MWAVVPVKDFARAKSRLAPALSTGERVALSRWLFEHVLDVLCACPELSGILVATDSADVENFARRRGARVVRDSGSLPLGRVIDDALAELAMAGAGAALVLMSDLPELSLSDVRELVALAVTSDVVAAPDRHERQTNALLLRLPAFAPTRFGQLPSFERHGADARAHGLRRAACRTPGLSLDLDDVDDLACWRQRRSA